MNNCKRKKHTQKNTIEIQCFMIDSFFLYSEFHKHTIALLGELPVN